MECGAVYSVKNYQRFREKHCLCMLYRVSALKMESGGLFETLVDLPV